MSRDQSESPDGNVPDQLLNSHSDAPVDLSADAPLATRFNVLTRAYAAARDAWIDSDGNDYGNFEPAYRQARENLAAAAVWYFDGALSSGEIDSPQAMTVIKRVSEHISTPYVRAIADQAVGRLLHRLHDALSDKDPDALEKLEQLHRSNTAYRGVVALVDTSAGPRSFAARGVVVSLNKLGERRILSGDESLAAHPVIETLLRPALFRKGIEKTFLGSLDSVGWREAVHMVIDRETGALRLDLPPGSQVGRLLKVVDNFFADLEIDDPPSVVGAALQETALQLGIVDDPGGEWSGDRRELDVASATAWATLLGGAAEIPDLQRQVHELYALTAKSLASAVRDRGREAGSVVAGFLGVDNSRFQFAIPIELERSMLKSWRETLKGLCADGVGLDDASVASTVSSVRQSLHKIRLQPEQHAEIARELAMIRPRTETRDGFWTPTRDLGSAVADLAAEVDVLDPLLGAQVLEHHVSELDAPALLDFLQIVNARATFARMSETYSGLQIFGSTSEVQSPSRREPEDTTALNGAILSMLEIAGSDARLQGGIYRYVFSRQGVTDAGSGAEAVKFAPALKRAFERLDPVGQLEFLGEMFSFNAIRKRDPISVYASTALLSAASALDDEGDTARADLLNFCVPYLACLDGAESRDPEMVAYLLGARLIGRPEADYLTRPLLASDRTDDSVLMPVIWGYLDHKRSIVAYDCLASSQGTINLSWLSRETRSTFAVSVIDSRDDPNRPTADRAVLLAFDELRKTTGEPSYKTARALAQGILATGHILDVYGREVRSRMRGGALDAVVNILGNSLDTDNWDEDRALASRLKGWIEARR